jgi:four helix bundle protein
LLQKEIVEMENYLTINDISAYKIAFELSNYVWDIVVKWDNFAKYTVGKQFTEAVASVSANIAEGFGQYFKKDKINFYRYGKGSVSESSDWNNKSILRSLLTQDQYTHIKQQLDILPKEINNLIRFTDQKLKI